MERQKILVVTVALMVMIGGGLTLMTISSDDDVPGAKPGDIYDRRFMK